MQWNQEETVSSFEWKAMFVVEDWMCIPPLNYVGANVWDIKDANHSTDFGSALC